MKEKLSQIKEMAIKRLADASDLKTLDDLRVEILGKKGELTQILKGMGSLSKEERPVIGQLANEVRTEIETKLEEAKAHLAAKAQEAKLKAETIDVTMPGKVTELGHKHPMTQVIDEIKNIIKEYDIQKIILGLPKNMNNTIGERAEITIKYQKILEDNVNIPVILFDERLTSVISNSILIEADISRKKRKKKVDSIAAQIILQDYLNKEKNENE